ncbi:MAG: hypothetical protein JW932_03890 [Deltaproteobacteria bacterium]|nr:hypothetical protein [Deltaproteobacteria bacterium]
MEDYSKSIELPRRFDIVMELEKTLDEIEKAFELDEINDVPDMVSFLKFLVKELDDIFTDEYENLRFREFVLRRKGREGKN